MSGWIESHLWQLAALVFGYGLLLMLFGLGKRAWKRRASSRGGDVDG